jgi:hypothetical protein
MADALLLVAGELPQAAQRLAEAEEMRRAARLALAEVRALPASDSAVSVPICIASA